MTAEAILKRIADGELFAEAAQSAAMDYFIQTREVGGALTTPTTCPECGAPCRETSEAERYNWAGRFAYVGDGALLEARIAGLTDDTIVELADDFNIARDAPTNATRREKRRAALRRALLGGGER